MRATVRNTVASTRGVSLIELIVVLAIIALLTSLLLVAVQASREGARRVTCQNNLRQLSFAMRTYTDTRKKYPDLSLPDAAGGWVVALLPYLEEPALEDELKLRPALTGANVSPLVGKRPALFTCPDGFEGESTLSAIPAAHYLVQLPPGRQRHRGRFEWTLGDAAIDCRKPWAAGPEAEITDRLRGEHSKTGPHKGGFLAITSGGEFCYFYLPE